MAPMLAPNDRLRIGSLGCEGTLLASALYPVRLRDFGECKGHVRSYSRYGNNGLPNCACIQPVI